MVTELHTRAHPPLLALQSSAVGYRPRKGQFNLASSGRGHRFQGP